MPSPHTATRALRQVLATSSSCTISAGQPSRRAIPAYALRGRTRSSSAAASSSTNARAAYRLRRSVNTASASSSSRRNHSTIAAEQPGPPAPAPAPAPTPIPDISDGDTYDIVIIGAGNAGLALACTLLSKPALMRDGTRILLVEGGSLDRVRSWSGKGEWENRVWTASGPPSSSTSQIHFPQMGPDNPMAYMTENTNLQRALLRKIEQDGKGRIVVQEGKKVEEMRMGEGGRWVGLRFGDDWVRGAVVVGADGYNSPVRAFSDISSFGHGYDTHAVVATLHHSPLHNHTAFQRFLSTGPIAFLPLSHDSTTLVWSTTPQLVAAYKALGPEGLAMMVNLGFCMDEPGLARINTHILTAHQQGTRFPTALLDEQWHGLLANLTTAQTASLPPPITSVAPATIASFPLKLSHAESYVGERTVLVGDAAHTIHPLAGQGLNMGLADVKVLGEVWERVKLNGGDLGAYTSLLPYTRERYPANHLLLSTTDKLHYLFGTRIPGINWARSVGMDVVNELGPLKKLLMGRVGAQASATSIIGGGAGGAGGSPMRPEGSVYEKAADGMDALRSVKTVAGMAVAAGRELVKGGARQLLERLAK
ncbi:hypothetical protein QFC21_005565 [Naganishia friedmannii]|uniref:Uncharacterized protein n=1 Tax=Naganishia friedmannii TaxID=89922 RepID=A0ACC2V8J8_9TREE|nr:hypothetical protein QFC21_005565 [Naganishia friedmannii]